MLKALELLELPEIGETLQKELESAPFLVCLPTSDLMGADTICSSV